MFERVMYFCVFQCFFYVKDISMGMLEEQFLEEGDPDMYEEEYNIMSDSREEHWMNIAEDG